MLRTEGHLASHFVSHLGTYQTRVDTVLREIAEQRIVARMWEGDHTVWKPEPTEISNRLGWLRSATAMRDDIGRIEHFVHDVRTEGFTHVVLLGMGGSSLAPALFSHIYRGDHEGLRLSILDSTNPKTIATYTTLFGPADTLFLVSSKSGTTVETLSLFKHFYNHVIATQQDDEVGRHFVAITDPHSPLAELATRHGFREVFLADPTIGGRYAALSHFGLVPAALVGIDLARLLDHAEQMMRLCGASKPVPAHPGARLGAVLGTLARGGRDKVTLVTSPSLSAFGDWVEQLLAESTGKDGTGLIPIMHEPLGLPELYGDDRLFIHLALSTDDEQQSEHILNSIAEAGHPVLHFHVADPYELGGQFILWEWATAIAGHCLGIHPFDQPNVEAAKQRAHDVVETYQATSALPEETPAATFDDVLLYGVSDTRSPEAALLAFLEQGQAGDYVTIQAYLPPLIETWLTDPQSPNLTSVIRETTEIQAVLLSMCARIRDKYQLAATFGYGPRYLHATGQLHKGDAGRGLFIQVTAAAPQDVPIPLAAGELNSVLSFDVLQAAQALGDRRALAEAGRRVMCIHIREHVAERLTRLNQALL